MHFLSPDHVMDLTERTVICVLRRPPTAVVLASLESRMQAAARSERKKLAYLHVVLNVPTTGRVDDEARTAFIATARRSLHLFEGAAMILMGEGFVGAAMRAGVSGGLMLIRPTVPVRIFGQVDEGIAWLSLLSAPHREATKIRDSAAQLSETLLKDYAP